MVGAVIKASDWNASGRDDQLACAAGIVTTAGDLVYATGANALARLAIGQANQPLLVNSGATAPTWPSPQNNSLTLDFGRRTTSDGGAYNTTIKAASAQSGGTDQFGHSLILSSGIGTGATSTGISFFTATAGGAGTADRTPTKKWEITGAGDILAANDNTNDIGFNGANRPRDLWLGRDAFIGSGNLYSAVGGTQLSVTPGSTRVNGTLDVTTTATQPNSDNVVSCGAAAKRWSVVYAATGTINTSSRAAKQDIAPLDPARALALVRGVAIQTFRYRTPDPDLASLTRVGFIAEDTDRLLSLDGASADPQTTASVALAAIQELARRLDALEAR